MTVISSQGLLLWVGIRLGEVTGTCPRGGKVQSEFPWNFTSWLRLPWNCMETRDTRSSHTSTWSVSRPSTANTTLPSTRGSTVGRSLINVRSAAQLSPTALCSFYITGVTLLKNFLFVKNVGKLFKIGQVSSDTTSSTAGRTHTSALSVDRSSNTGHISCGTSRHTQERSPMSALSVGRAPLRALP